ncbi:MAG: hypothetical protein ACTSVL_08545 [Promethearchaeota archaeon]
MDGLDSQEVRRKNIDMLISLLKGVPEIPIFRFDRAQTKHGKNGSLYQAYYYNGIKEKAPNSLSEIDNHVYPITFLN